MNIAQNKNDGREFQTEIERSAARTPEKLRIRKVDPPVRVLGFGPKRKVIFVENPWLDFVGCWTERQGRSLHIEAKETAEDKLGVGGSSGVKETQVEAMRQWTAAGADCFVLWKCPSGVCLLPYSLIRLVISLSSQGKGFKHIKWVDVDTNLHVETVAAPGGWIHKFVDTMERIYT